MDAGNEMRNGNQAEKGRLALLSSFAWKSRLLFLCILALGIIPAGYAVGQIREAINAHQQVSQAHRVLNWHLKLSQQGHRLSHHVTHIGKSDDAQGRELQAGINSIALALRRSIAGEVALRGDAGLAEEGEEIDRVDAILSSLNASITGPHDSRWVDLIEQAVAHEEREVAEIETRARRALVATMIALVLSSAFVLMLYIVALYWLDRSITLPLRRLRLATEKVAEGARKVRISRMRDSEFEALAENFNRMAAVLDDRRSAMESSTQALEQQVKERTTELEIANNELKQNAVRRKNFLTEISHELRTPLAVIRGDAEVTLRGSEKPVGDYKSALGRIATQVVGITRLVDDLLYVARNESGAPALQSRPLDLLLVINQAANAMRPAIEDDSGHIVVSTRLKVARIMGDDLRLGQLMYILLDNAIHYSDGPPEIEIELLHSTDGYALLVHDHGIGIADSDLPGIFDRFQRGRNGKNGEGVGIGLPLAKAIVEAHGGTITVGSTLGAGTTVSVMLPAVEKMKVAHEHTGG
jgi:two-component system, OmpR family, sensor kinase